MLQTPQEQEPSAKRLKPQARSAIALKFFFGGGRGGGCVGVWVGHYGPQYQVR